MFLGVAAVLHRVVTFNAPSRRWPMAILLVTVLLGIFWAQLTLSKPIIHWVAFAGMLAVVWRRVTYLIRVTALSTSQVAEAQKVAMYGFGIERPSLSIAI